ncbi:cytochrome c biogenesis protein transmembrane region [Gloeomargarita lithophora Alchichica-D10]|uniref:Cytochrome c biogenesis protein transmembrane region n=1 Tax=Gloeomargarita lithophora Alchichica-D10 TaxID=1188229 RepID=A0A1J0A927_9CYAN|nr:cytochrome c biogenesis protein CcdA [Gloeomargarita lithophora]APB32409.1 cytochrome c biogenesis protein transmembrane region [Gloeomargarita lithophora Alchichica-D10]
MIDITGSLYGWEQWANQWVIQELEHLSPVSLGLVLTAGIVTSLNPCVLSLLPVTVACLGADQRGGWRQASWFTLGLASTLTGLGMGAALLGRVYGQWGSGLSLLVAGVAIWMGLVLLEVLPMPVWAVPSEQTWGTGGWRAYGLGVTFGLGASPCSTPVLASLLAWVASTGNVPLGFGLLLAYTLGYTLPVWVAGTFTATLGQWLRLRPISRWFPLLSGLILLGFGVYTLLGYLEVRLSFL